MVDNIKKLAIIIFKTVNSKQQQKLEENKKGQGNYKFIEDSCQET
jgi:hypothetical protein